MQKHQYIEVLDQEYAEKERCYNCVAVTLVVNGTRMPYKRYDFTGNTGFAKARQKAIALALRLAQQLSWEAIY